MAIATCFPAQAAPETKLGAALGDIFKLNPARLCFLTFSIIGVPASVVSGQIAFTNINESPISFATFFDTTTLNAIVKAKGNQTIDNEIDASSGEVEIDD